MYFLVTILFFPQIGVKIFIVLQKIYLKEYLSDSEDTEQRMENQSFPVNP